MWNKFRTTFRSKTAAPRRRTKPARRKAPARQLKMEFLEQRLTLSGSPVIVTSSADSGPGTLRDAIAGAVSGETIEFARNVHAITLTSGELAISTNLDIEGPGANKLTISGNNNSRVFDISGPSIVTIAGLTVANGKSEGTIAELANGAPGGYTAGGGGGIYNHAGATLTLDHDSLSGNQATHGPSADSFSVCGGALLNLGTAIVTHCEFTRNKAVGGNGFDNMGGSMGGAIDNFGGPTGGAHLTVADTTFCSNSTVAAPGFWGIGGAIEMNGGLNGYDPAYSEPSTAVITNSSFLNNLSTGGANTSGQAGAFCMEGAGSTTMVTGCTISGNQAVGGDYATGFRLSNSEGQGGAIIAFFGTMNIDKCVITNNRAIAGNNGDATADPTLAGAFGGAIENNYLGVVNITNSVISGNTAEGGANTAGQGGMAVGGGISNSPHATMNMTNCIVSGNRAIGGKGLGVAGGFAFGGGIDISNFDSTATIIGSQIAGNIAVGGAGGAGQQGGAGYGGGIGVGWGDLVGYGPDHSQLTLVNSALLGNQAVGGRGGTGANGGDGLGGGLAIMADSSATVTGSLISLDSAVGGKKGSGGGTSAGHGIGGGVYNAAGATGFTKDLLSAIDFNFASTSNFNIYP
jgi:hypothetical protein